jgi:hypothetical protein
MMKQQNARQIWIVLVVLALAVLACGGGAEATATALPPRPTQKPNPTATKPAPRPTATRSSVRPTATQADATETGGSAIILSDTPYDHPSGAFSLTLPQDWEIDEKDNSVFVTSPDKVVAIEVSFTNVSNPLAEDELNTFIQAVEDNWFATFPNYTPGDFEPQSDGSIGVFKTLDLASGTPQSVFSYYWQQDAIVYEQDFWVDTDQYDLYVDGLVEVANSMSTDPSSGTSAEPYDIVYTFTEPNNLFEFNVPYPWPHAISSADNATVDTFTSPNNLSYIENIIYDDGTAVTRSDAGAFARSLLEKYYEITDLTITDDQVQSDGSERLTWTSAAKGIDGESFFETRGTTFLLLTWVVDSASYDSFEPVWKRLVESYTVPQ